MLSPQDEEFLKQCKEMVPIHYKNIWPGIENLLRIVAELKKELNEQIDLYLKLNDDAGTVVKGLKKERDGLREELNKEKLAHWNFHKDQADSFKNKS